MDIEFLLASVLHSCYDFMILLFSCQYGKNKTKQNHWSYKCKVYSAFGLSVRCLLNLVYKFGFGICFHKKDEPILHILTNSWIKIKVVLPGSGDARL